MKAVFSNVWTKRLVSLITVLYTVSVCYMGYYSVFYKFHVESGPQLCLLVSGLSLIALVLMLYTREQFLTKLSSFVILIAMLPVVILCFREKELYLPIVITGIIILLFSGAGEGKKTLLGTLILLMYIFSGIGFYIFNSFFVTHAETEIVEQGVSPSGKYRYKIVNTEDTSGGSTSVIFEPNDADIEFPFVKMTLKNMEHICYLERPICEDISLEWTTESRGDITDKLNKLSDSIMVSLTNSECEKFGIEPDRRLQLAEISVYELMEIGKTASDVEPLKLDTLSESQLEHFGIAKDDSERYYVLDPTAEFYESVKKIQGERVYLGELDKDGYRAFNRMHLDDYGYTLFEIGEDNEVPLSALSDEQLEALGISPEGDVLSFNGKVCFRYYVAELEKYFDTESRKLSVDLLS